jgi:DNA-binding response OmpR family regulator
MQAVYDVWKQGYGMSNQKILLVDDEADILDLLEKALSLDGFENVHRAANGLEAVDICRRVDPNIIILDVMLPDIDGYEVCNGIFTTHVMLPLKPP